MFFFIILTCFMTAVFQINEDVSPTTYGFVVASIPVTLMIVSPLLGHWSNKVSNKCFVVDPLEVLNTEFVSFRSSVS